MKKKKKIRKSLVHFWPSLAFSFCEAFTLKEQTFRIIFYCCDPV